MQTFQVSAYIRYTNIPPAKVSQMAEGQSQSGSGLQSYRALDEDIGRPLIRGIMQLIFHSP